MINLQEDRIIERSAQERFTSRLHVSIFIFHLFPPLEYFAVLTFGVIIITAVTMFVSTPTQNIRSILAAQCIKYTGDNREGSTF